MRNQTSAPSASFSAVRFIPAEVTDKNAIAVKKAKKAAKRLRQKEKRQQLQVVHLEEAKQVKHEEAGGVNANGNAKIIKSPGEAAAKVMQQELVLKNIASRLPGRALRSLRQTCSTWEDVLTPSWMKVHAPIKLNNIKWDDDIDNDNPSTDRRFNWRYLSARSKIKGRRVADFNANMKATVEAGQTITFTAFQFWLDGGKACSDLKEFFILFGNSIRSLSLEKAGRSRSWLILKEGGLDLDFIRQLIFDKLPELKVLDLKLTEEKPIYDHIKTDRIKSQQLKEVPNLEQLTLTDSSYGDLTQETKAFLTEVIKGLVCLKTLILNGKLGTILPIVRDFAPWQSLLTTLELSSQPAVEDLQTLNEIVVAIQKTGNTLRLKVIKFAFQLETIEDRDHATEFTRELYSFLDSQSGSLCVLELRTITRSIVFDQTSSAARLQIPFMAVLLEFRVFRRGGVQFLLDFDGGSLVDNFPELKMFGYKHRNNHRHFTFTGDNDWLRLGHPGVTQLELTLVAPTYYRPRVHQEMNLLNIIAAGFPGVTHLVLAMSVQTMGETHGQGQGQAHNSLSTIWSSWPLLISALIQCDVLDRYNRLNKTSRKRKTTIIDLDKALTGILIPADKPRRANKRIKAYKNQLVSNFGGATATATLVDVRAHLDSLEQHKIGPGLSDMTQLQRLALDFRGTRSVLKLSDFGGYFGFAMAPQLCQYIILDSKGARVSISRECKAMVAAARGPGPYF